MPAGGAANGTTTSYSESVGSVGSPGGSSGSSQPARSAGTASAAASLQENTIGWSVARAGTIETMLRSAFLVGVVLSLATGCDGTTGGGDDDDDGDGGSGGSVGVGLVQGNG